MTTITNTRTEFFYPLLAAVAMIAPILLVLSANRLPEGLERGEFIVSGLGLELAVLAAALVLRAAYALGFTKAVEIVTLERNESVTA